MHSFSNWSQDSPSSKKQKFLVIQEVTWSTIFSNFDEILLSSHWDILKLLNNVINKHFSIFIISQEKVNIFFGGGNQFYFRHVYIFILNWPIALVSQFFNFSVEWVCILVKIFRTLTLGQNRFYQINITENFYNVYTVHENMMQKPNDSNIIFLPLTKIVSRHWLRILLLNGYDY